MKKKILLMLLVGITSINLLGCSEKKVTGNEEGNKPKATEQQGSKKISEKELNEKFEKSKEQLGEFFKENEFKEQIYTNQKSGKDDMIKWQIEDNSKDDFYYAFTLKNSTEGSPVSLMIQARVKSEKFEDKSFKVDIDNSIILAAYEIFKNEKGFKYGEHGKKIEESLKAGENLMSSYTEEINDGNYKHDLRVSASTITNNFMITISYGNN